MKNFLFALAVLVSSHAYTQIIISPDTTICGNYQDTLFALSANQSSMAVDDQCDVVVPIGFTFNFYGLPYTQLVVSGNGYITFDLSQASQYSPWSINTAIPNPGNLPENAILAPWQDINTGIGGAIYYGVTGIAPNRRFIVTWCAVPMFSCTNLLHTSQVVLYEGSNKIEMFIQNKPLCSTWNGGKAIQGLVNINSTNFDIVNDPILLQPRNSPLQWQVVVPEGWEFLPNVPATSYTINSIVYVPIIAGANTWTDANGNILAIGPTLAVNISTTTTYFANITGVCAFGNLSDSITITVPACFDINLSSVEASCLGDDGIITCIPDTLLPLWNAELLDMNGATVAFVPNIVATSYTFSNLFPGTYIVQATSGISTAVDTIVVGQVQNPISLVSNAVGVNCYSGNDGQIGVSASGGLLPYTFYINGVLNINAYPYDSLFQNLSGGTYIISVIDANNCMNRDTVVVASPHYTLQALAASKIIICNGDSDGEVVGSAAGGTHGYSYEWFDSGLNSFSINDTAFGLSAGTYYLEVMDANGCDTFTTVNVIAPQLPLSASPQVFVVSCKGEATGMIVGDASGSWAPYQYQWFNQNNVLLQSSPGWPTNFIVTRDTLKDLLAGVYSLTLTDAQGCSILYTFNIAEPSFALSIDSMKVIDGIACYGDSVGIARLYASGGDPAYSYLWDNGETGLIATGLTSGYHTVRLTDDWGCEVLDSLYIPENTLINSTLVANTTVSCYGLSDGVASISTLGGASSLYTYFWSQGQTTYTVNTDVAYGLLQGSYYVTTRDALGCEVVDSIYISHPEPLLMEVSEVDWIDCFGADNGEAYAYAQGGTTAYSFSWDNGTWLGATVTTLTPGVHTVVVTDARGCTATDTIFTHEPLVLDVNIDDSQTVLPYCIGVNTASLSAIASGGTPGYSYEWNDNLVQPQITSTATALLAGTYTITVTDSKGCTASDTRTIANTNTMGTSVSSLQTISCYGENDGQALVSTVGGHAPYTYEWYGPNGYGSTNDTISNLLAGVYSVTVRDTNNCMKNSSIIITQPSNMFFTTLGATAESCLGACNGQVQVNVTGGIAPYVAIATATTGNVITSPMVNNSMVTGICSGTYSLTFSDANGCSSTLINGGVNQQTISTSNTTVAQINTTNILPILCNGASTGSLAALNPNTSTGYTYSWANINNPTAILSNTTTASNLLAGTYVLYADYNNTSGCRATDTATITQLAIINPSAVITPVDCYGDNTGMLQGSVQGGTAPYTYSWNTIPIQTTQTINNLQAGSYTLTITDANNCSQVDIFDITQPQVLLASISQSGYVLTASVPTGGTSPYSYSWRKQPSTTPIGSGLNYVVNSYGTYYVVITDANSCTSQSNTITYSEGPLGTIDFSTAINLRVYPNPFREETTVDFGQRINKATIRIVDVYGKLVESYELADTDKYIIKRTNKASGIYFMEIEINKEYLNNIKLVIE